MTEEELMKKYGEEYAVLKQMCIYELRNCGREKGIKCPAARTKEEMIRCILKIDPVAESIQKTTMQFTINELKTLAELVYMGFYVANEYRKEHIEEQFAVSSAVYREYSTLKNKVAHREDIEENEIADIRDELCSETSEYIAQFEKNILLEKLEQLRNYICK